ncbi:hypothetical protein ES707_00523 [subsurface metagenome]|jgi:uncharacterized protein YlxW (UPF0749 family)
MGRHRECFPEAGLTWEKKTELRLKHARKMQREVEERVRQARLEVEKLEAEIKEYERQLNERKTT